MTADMVVLYPSEKLYYVDLNTRTIEAPEYIGVERDCNAETIYFTVDRFFENLDLSNLSCIIQFENANGESYIYPVPFFDKTTLYNEGLLIFPWTVSGPATAKAGLVHFAMKFFSVDLQKTTKPYIFNLNTITCESQVLEGMDILTTYEVVQLEAGTYEKNKYFIKTINNDYIISNDDFVAGETYYKQVEPEQYKSLAGGKTVEQIIDGFNQRLAENTTYWTDV